MTSLPLFHINAPAYSVLGSVAARASLVLLPRFSAGGFIDSARRYGATEFNAIGAMLEILMRQPERPDDADNPLRLAYAGPTPPEERHLEFERRFGLELMSGYAMSETPYGTVWPHGTRPYGTLGVPRQHPTLGRVNEARVSADGELELRNPAVMKGYWGMPEETERGARARTAGSRPATSCARTTDGTYTFLGRRKEVIRRRGENVAPAEIEEALASHPDVLEAAVVGVPSELSEEDIKAFVVMRDGAERRLRRAARLGLGAAHPFKVPSQYEALDELPHTPRDGSRNIGSPHELSTTSVGTSDADSITVMGRDLSSELMGETTLHRARVPAGAAARCPPPRRRGCSTRSSSRSRTTASLRRCSPRGSPIPGRPSRSRAPSPPAFWVPGRSSWGSWRTRSVPGRSVGDDVEAGCPRDRGGEARSRAWGIRSTRSRTRGPRGSTRSPRRPASWGRTWRRLREVAAAYARPDRPGAAHQRRGRGGRGARGSRLPGAAATRLRAAGADRGVARSPRGRDAEPYRDASLPRGG